MSYTVEIRCAWCNQFLRLADYTAEKPGLISHGICNKCYKLECEKLEKFEKGKIDAGRNQF